MSNIIMAIALWCGNPKLSDPLEIMVVNQCRKELMLCTLKDPNGNGFIECFKKQELVDSFNSLQKEESK